MKMPKIVLMVVLVALLSVPSFALIPKDLFLHEGLQGTNFEDGRPPLILTKYLDQPAMGRGLSKVVGLGNLPSYSGFFTTNATAGSNMFFWYFPAQDGNPTAPLVMFLQGGPGASSMFGLFYEMGPYRVAADGKTLLDNPYTWNKHYGMVFVDNPVGAGWSFTQHVGGFVKNEEDVANNLLSALEQFFTIFDDQQHVDFYVAGESYAGHYVLSISRAIWKRNQGSPKVRINLKGISIGDGSIEPLIQFNVFSQLLFNLGLTDLNQVRVIAEHERHFVEAVRAKEFVKAFHIFDKMLNGDFFPYPTLFANMTGLNNYFNFLEPTYPSNPYQHFLNLESTRTAIHVGSSTYWDYNSTVEFHLIPDWMTSVSHLLKPVMENYKVLIYTGQLDLILGSAGNELFLEKFDWSGAHSYRTSPKSIWRIGNDASRQPAGYARSAGNFRQVVVRKAGHLLPLDAPEEALDMITRFINNIPF